MLRLTLYGGAVPLGLATGLAAWLLAGGASGATEPLEALQAKIAALRAPSSQGARAGYARAADLISAPLFALTTGPGALREPSIRLDGIAISTRRMAALVSIDGKAADWLQVGEARDGITLQALTSGQATFETGLGSKELALGEQSAASAPLVGAGPEAATAPPLAVVDQIPPGFRSPPPPASAPQAQP